MPKAFFFRRRPALFALCITLLLCTIWGIIWYTQPANRYERAAKQLFIDEMISSTLNMHYTLANPEDYGIQQYEAILPCYAGDKRQAGIVSLEESLDFYQSLDSSKLTNRDAHTVTLLTVYLENTLALSRYPYYEEPLSPASGMQSQLPILLAEYTFRNRQDVEDYLDILSQTGEYFSSLLNFEKEKKAAGLLMAASSLRSVAEQCRTILTAEALEKGEHFLQITFQERLQELTARLSSAIEPEASLTSQEIDTYINQNNQILEDIMLPAYEQLADGLESLADSAILLEGLAAKPEGAAYYEALLRSETGSIRNISEISQILVAKLDKEF